VYAHADEQKSVPCSMAFCACLQVKTPRNASLTYARGYKKGRSDRPKISKVDWRVPAQGRRHAGDNAAHPGHVCPPGKGGQEGSRGAPPVNGRTLAMDRRGAAPPAAPALPVCRPPASLQSAGRATRPAHLRKIADPHRHLLARQDGQKAPKDFCS